MAKNRQKGSSHQKTEPKTVSLRAQSVGSREARFLSRNGTLDEDETHDLFKYLSLRRGQRKTQ